MAFLGKMLHALGRVLQAPRLFFAVLLLQWATAWLIGSTVRTAVSVNLGSFAVLEGQGLFYSILELLLGHPAIAAVGMQLAASAALLSILFWTLMAGGVLESLQRPLPLGEALARGFRWLPAMVTVTLWHMIPRLILLGGLGALASQLDGPLKWAVGLLALLVLFYCHCALDLARAAIVTGRSRPHRWRSAFRGYAQAAKRPGVLLASSLFSLMQWLIVLFSVYIALSGFHTGGILWPVRILSVVGLVCILGRIAVALDALRK